MASAVDSTRWMGRWPEMSEMNDQPGMLKGLLSRAEDAARASPAWSAVSLESASPVEVRRILQELQVHQIELEMQNEELRRVQLELDASKRRYFDLYEMAPVGYCTLSEKGVILQANLRLASLLGLTQGKLLARPLSRFIHPEDQTVYYHYRRLISGAVPSPALELRLLRAQAPPFWARIESTLWQDSADAPELLVAIFDITPLKQVEDRLHRLNEELETQVKARTLHLGQMYARMLTAQEDERKRVALDLHDSLGQTLSAIKLMGGQVLAGSRIKPGEGDLAHLPDMLTALTGAIEDVRQISTNLRPSMLDDLGILAALSWLVRGLMSAQPGVKVGKAFEVEEAVIPEALKITLFRLVQEAFQNAVKHSQATEIRLSLGLAGGRLTLKISDNGRGFEPRTGAPHDALGGLGLASMRERTGFSGGTFELTSSVGNGTQIAASWVLP